MANYDEDKYMGKYFYVDNYLCYCNYAIAKALHPLMIFLNLMYSDKNEYVLTLKCDFCSEHFN